jgi:hypothetical protein
MAVIVDKLGPGTLTLGSAPSDFSLQVSRAALVPESEEEDATPTLGEPEPVPDITTTWTLEGDAISDWADETGFINYCFDNAGTEVPFEFVPNTGKAVQWTGTVQVRAMTVGGSVSEQIVESFSFPVKGQPVRSAYTPTAKAATGAKVTK